MYAGEGLYYGDRLNQRRREEPKVQCYKREGRNSRELVVLMTQDGGGMEYFFIWSVNCWVGSFPPLCTSALVLSPWDQLGFQFF